MNLLSLLYRIQDAIPAIPDSVPSVGQESRMLKSLTFDEFINHLVNGIVKLAINVAIAVVVFYVGKFIIRKLYNLVRGIMLRRNVDSSLSTFVLSFVRIVLYFILIVTVIGILGIETSSFLALFASAGVAIGMALSGTLQNFAGGVLILLLKPYKVGDYIEAQGYAGTVKEIQIFHTLIITPDNKSIIIPNGGLSTGSINNWSREAYRRIDWTVGISYGENVQQAREEILAIFAADNRIVKTTLEAHTSEIRAAAAAAGEDDPAPSEPDEATSEAGDDSDDTRDEKPRRILGIFKSGKARIEQRREQRRRKIEMMLKPRDCSPSVLLEDLGDSAVVLKVRAWALSGDYWAVYYGMLERIYDRFNDIGISFPFPQLDVHMIPQPANNEAGNDK
ncbi:MAG: mechanosensitive ion channel [Muribaculaceae bacterium]|nr:mechanosensitive ion channel [Muribaculaceae bacterium]